MKTRILAVVVLLALAGTAGARTNPKRVPARPVAVTRRAPAHHPHERPDDAVTRGIHMIAGALIVVVSGMLLKSSKELLDSCAADAMLPARG